MVAPILVVVLIALIASTAIVIVPGPDGESLGGNFGKFFSGSDNPEESNSELNEKLGSGVDMAFDTGINGVKTVVDGVDVDKMNLPTGLDNEGKDKILDAGIELVKDLKDVSGSAHKVTEIAISENVPPEYNISPELIFVIALIASAVLFWKFTKVILEHAIRIGIIVGIVIIILVVYQVSTA